MADESLFRQTLESDMGETPFIDKEVLWIQDLNNGSYSGTIQINTSQLANSSRWLSYKEGYIQVPYVLSIKSDQDASAAMNAFVCGLKNGTHHLIDSIQVDYNNVNLIQSQTLTNFLVHYEVLSQWSNNDLKKRGPTQIVYPDSVDSQRFAAALSVDGDGYSNNRVDTTGIMRLDTDLKNVAPDWVALDDPNSGLLPRLRRTGQTSGAQVSKDTGRNYYSTQGAAAARVYYWSILATIRLKDLSDLFRQMPLVRGCTLNIYLKYNSFSATVSAVAASDNMRLTNIIARAGNTNPMMMMSGAIGQPSFDLLAIGSNQSLSLQCDLVSTPDLRTAGESNPCSFSTCRLYVPSYEMNPVFEKRLLEEQPVKEIKFLDHFQYTVNVGASATFNTILTNGISNAKRLIVCPIIDSTQGGVFSIVTNPTYQSPFDSSPGVLCDFAPLTNYNVQVSGRNLYQQDFQYGWEQYINETATDNAVNGNTTDGLVSGLINQDMWEKGYSYYVSDLSRIEPSDANVPRSILIKGKNATTNRITLVCFVQYERSIKIEFESGKIVN